MLLKQYASDKLTGQRYTVPLILDNWARKPCDALFLGKAYWLDIIVEMLRMFGLHSFTYVHFSDLCPTTSFRIGDKRQEAWGADLPLTQPVLLITGVTEATTNYVGTLTVLENLLLLRRSSSLLTIVSSPYTYTAWNKMLAVRDKTDQVHNISFRFVLEARA